MGRIASMLLESDIKTGPSRYTPQKNNQCLCQEGFKNSFEAEFGAKEPVVASFSPQLASIICNASPGLPLFFLFYIHVFCEVTLTQ